MYRGNSGVQVASEMGTEAECSHRRAELSSDRRKLSPGHLARIPSENAKRRGEMFRAAAGNVADRNPLKETPRTDAAHFRTASTVRQYEPVYLFR